MTPSETSAADHGITIIDTGTAGMRSVTAGYLIDAPRPTLIECGPARSIDTVIEGLRDLGMDPADLAYLVVSHIHLDHAGGAGTLVRRWPELPVYVHERGARHLADPSRLLASAERLYGDRMDELWGEVAPVPEPNLRPLAGGEEVLGFEVAYTPGHASHHVSYLHRDSGRAFVGDTAAVRIPPSDYVLPPTPPPDIDLEAWDRSLDAIADWTPRSLALTHFGAVDDPGAHIEEVRRRLAEQAERARTMDAAEFERTLIAEAERRGGPEAREALLQAVPPDQQWTGLDRYLTRDR